MSENIQRKDIDDYGRRNSNNDSYKNRSFIGKRTTMDEYTGEKLYYSSKGITAKSEQSRHFTTKKTANVDHIVPIDQMISKYGKDISKEQLKRITNSDYNLAITSESLNKSKSNMSNHKYLYKQFREGTPENIITTYNMLQKEVSATTAVTADITVTKVSETVGKATNINKKSLKNVTLKVGNSTGSAVNSGTSAALMSLTVSSINNIVLVATGEKDLDVALKDVANDTSGSFVSAVGLDLAQHAISDVANHFGNLEVTKILSKDLPIAEISTMIMVGNSVVRYINDDISAEECVTEIIMNGAGALAYHLGMMAGGPAGAIITSIIVGQISKIVLEYKQFKKINTEKEIQINNIVKDALIEMERQRCKLENIMNEEFKKWDNAFNNGYKQIFISALDNNVEGISQGINSILYEFNERCKFSTLNEFNDFFDDLDAVLTI